MRWWCFCLLQIIAIEAKSNLDSPENALEFIHLDYVSNHKSKQNKLRQLIIRQDRTEDKIIRTRRQNKKSFNMVYLTRLRKLQRDMQGLKDWRKKQPETMETLENYENKFKSLENQIAQQGDLITRLVYGHSSRRRSRRPRSRRLKSSVPLARSRRSVTDDSEDQASRIDRLENMFYLVIQRKDSEIEDFKKSMNEMKIKVADLEFSLDNANERFEGVQLETARLLETEVMMNETIADLEQRLYEAEARAGDNSYEGGVGNSNQPLTPEFPSSSSSSSVVRSTPEHQELEAEIQFLYDKIAQMENDMNVTTSSVAEHAENAKLLAEEAYSKLEILKGQVVYNTELNQMSSSNKEELAKVSNKLQQHSLQLLNETVSESMAIVDDVRDIHHAQMSSLDAKVDENEDSLLYINSTLDTAVGKLDDLGVHMNGFAQALERFSNLYHKLEGDVNIFKVNATANMASFDRTVDLSIDLLDRMGQFNEDIVSRVSKLEETAYYSDTTDYEDDYKTDYEPDYESESNSDYTDESESDYFAERLAEESARLTEESDFPLVAE